jgi:hypothetical protein
MIALGQFYSFLADAVIQERTIRDAWLCDPDRRDADPDYYDNLPKHYANYVSPARLEQQVGAYERELAEYLAAHPPMR